MGVLGMTEQWTASIVNEDWSAPVTEETWTLDSDPSITYTTQVVSTTVTGGGSEAFRVTHTPSDCTDAGDDDGTVLELTVVGGHLDYNRVICDENPSDQNGRAAIVGPNPDDCLGDVLEVLAGSAAVHGASFWWNKPTPAVLWDLADLPTLSYPLDFTGSPTAVVFDSASGPVTWTLDTSFANAGVLFASLLAALDGVATFETSFRVYADVDESTAQSCLVSVATGTGATLEVLDPGAGDPIGLSTLTHTPGDVVIAGYQNPLGSIREGRGRGGTHTWPDLVRNGKCFTVVANPGQWTLVDMSVRPENIPYTSQAGTPVTFAGVGDVRGALDAAEAVLDSLSVSAGSRARNLTRVTTAYDIVGTDGLVVLAGAGDYNVTLPTTGFADGQEVMVWGASTVDPCMILTSATLYDLDGVEIGYNPTVALGQVLLFSFFTAVDMTPSWRLTYDSSAGGGGTGDVVGPASSTDGDPVLFDGTTGKLIKAGATNTANGLVKLDGSNLIPDSLIPSSIARDSEITSALASYLTSATAASTYQPLDSDLTAIAALTTTSFGRSVLEAASAAALRTLAGLVIGTDVQAYDADLASIAALSTTSFGRARLTEASGWVPISDTLVSNGGSGVASISVSCSGYRHLRIRFKGRSTRTGATTDTLSLTFNSDSTSKYGKNGGALQTSYSVSTAWTSSNTNTDRMGSTDITVDCGSSSWTVFRALTEVMASTATVGTTIDSAAGVYTATSAITSFQLQFASGNIADGSSLIVEGWA